MEKQFPSIRFNVMIAIFAITSALSTSALAADKAKKPAEPSKADVDNALVLYGKYCSTQSFIPFADGKVANCKDVYEFLKKSHGGGEKGDKALSALGVTPTDEAGLCQDVQEGTGLESLLEDLKGTINPDSNKSLLALAKDATPEQTPNTFGISPEKMKKIKADFMNTASEYSGVMLFAGGAAVGGTIATAATISSVAGCFAAKRTMLENASMPWDSSKPLFAQGLAGGTKMKDIARKFDEVMNLPEVQNDPEINALMEMITKNRDSMTRQEWEQMMKKVGDCGGKKI